MVDFVLQAMRDVYNLLNNDPWSNIANKPKITKELDERQFDFTDTSAYIMISPNRETMQIFGMQSGANRLYPWMHTIPLTLDFRVEGDDDTILETYTDYALTLLENNIRFSGYVKMIPRGSWLDTTTARGVWRQTKDIELVRMKSVS